MPLNWCSSGGDRCAAAALTLTQGSGSSARFPKRAFYISSTKVRPEDIRNRQYGHRQNKADRPKQETASKQGKGPKSQRSAEQNGLKKNPSTACIANHAPKAI